MKKRRAQNAQRVSADVLRPGEQGTAEAAVKTAPPRIHSHTLVEINRAAFTARRAAAHARVAELLRRDILGSPDKESRTRMYRFCLRLLEDALTATRRSQLQQDSPVTHYLGLLRETVSANLALVSHELTLLRETAEFSRLLGDVMTAQFQSAGEVFSNSEMNILECIGDLLSFGEQLLSQDTAVRTEQFSADDRARYETAMREYTGFYREPSPDFE